MPTTDVAAKEGSGPSGAQRPDQGRGRVLVVEDNLDAADALTMLLQIMGFETLVAHDGREAIELARTQPFALIFIDIGLPGMDGYEVARRLKGIETRKSTMIVALTGYGREEDKTRALGAGFDVHLVKPVEMETLEQLLSRLEQPEATSEAV
jgi:CheY-like chemotaxis protein